MAPLPLVVDAATLSPYALTTTWCHQTLYYTPTTMHPLLCILYYATHYATQKPPYSLFLSPRPLATTTTPL